MICKKIIPTAIHVEFRVISAYVSYSQKGLTSQILTDQALILSLFYFPIAATAANAFSAAAIFCLYLYPIDRTKERTLCHDVFTNVGLDNIHLCMESSFSHSRSF